MIFMLTGESGSGKTTLLGKLAELLRHTGYVAGGFIAPGTWDNGRRNGFSLFSLLSETVCPLARTTGPGIETMGRFAFSENALILGNQILQKQLSDPLIDVIVVDEVGPLELKGGGWAPSLDMLRLSQKNQIWVVRKELVDQVSLNWRFVPARVFTVPEFNAEMVFEIITELIQKNSHDRV